MKSRVPTPSEIRYHQRSRVLELAYESGQRFELDAEFLRVHSPSAEVRGHGPGQEVLQTGKEAVGIVKIEPVGHYALRLHFDDGHDTGLYSWEELFDMGSRKDDLWADYLQRLAASGHGRGDA